MNTPGPWTLKQHGPNHFTLTGQAPGLIADIHSDQDAALVRAAPELLEVLRYARHVMEGNGLHRSKEWSTGYPKLWADINAVLAKATEV